MLAKFIFLVIIKIVLFREFEYFVTLQFLLYHLLKGDVVRKLLLQVHQYPQALPFIFWLSQFTQSLNSLLLLQLLFNLHLFLFSEYALKIFIVILLLLPLLLDLINPLSDLHLSLVVVFVVVDNLLHTHCDLLVFTESFGELCARQLDSRKFLSCLDLVLECLLHNTSDLVLWGQGLMLF